MTAIIQRAGQAYVDALRAVLLLQLYMSTILTVPACIVLDVPTYVWELLHSTLTMIWLWISAIPALVVSLF